MQRLELTAAKSKSDHSIARQNFECSTLRGSRQRMGVLPHGERTVHSVTFPVVTNRLGDGQNVRFGECTVQRRASMTARSKVDKLVGVCCVG
jgi:hypothetical protein